MSSSRLFEPLRIGNVQLKHRVVMAPLTRYRADDQHVHTPMAIEYYTQRAAVPGTLLITEATFISPRASGYNNVPGIYNQAQIKAWKAITDAVHAKGSFIFCQLWALGRAAKAEIVATEPGNLGVVSASAIPISPDLAVPRALTEPEIHAFIADYASAAKNAIEAGFDGVEIHGANGYLVDQFTQDVSNRREDQWGGSIENRARFGLEVTKAVVAAVGKERTAIRLSPWSTFQAMKMADPVPQFSYLVRGLQELGLAYLHLVESRIAGSQDIEATHSVDFAIDLWGTTSPVLIAGGFQPDSAKRTADEIYKDRDVAVVFGRYFVSNPDLPFRLQQGIDFTPYERPKFYNAKSADGYVTYPFSKEFQKLQAQSTQA
ncbi:MAG: Chanoclavine-I aldehyde reductase fgaOx3 [Thelocarpon superellum]|nr:MAG: Chanoclavine-I aldehyde reductase fgaOx3 [Thelocarpon superellum]